MIWRHGNSSRHASMWTFNKMVVGKTQTMHFYASFYEDGECDD